MKLVFDPKHIFYKEPFGAVAVDAVIAFRTVLVPEQESCQEIRQKAKKLKILLCIREDGKDEVYYPAVPVSDEFSQVKTQRWKESEREKEEVGLVYGASWKACQRGLFFYRFCLREQEETLSETEECQLTVYERGFETPDWLWGGLMYQIFPDRFAKSRTYEPPAQKKNYRMHQFWGEEPDSGPDERGIVWNNDFFGGNLRGIVEKLPYLQDLGVTVLYLNPIFRAFSNHRYDTADYATIDPMLGTEDDFSLLCGEAGKRGIRIILDGVFNHTGSHSIYFNKDGFFPGKGACQGQDSPYYSWYRFQEYPQRYDCWWGIDTLPAVNEMEESYRDFIIRGENSIIRRWMRLGASGFRLDVADELPDEFIRELRRAVKEENPQGAVIGEVWEDASNKIAYGERRRYLQGEELDSVMNYPLKEGILSFLNDHRDGEILQELILTLMERYPPMCFYALMNILGTHDTERIFTVLKGPGTTERACRTLFLALMLWGFLPGIPCIYYGDELGMEGGRDPFNRRCFEPEKAKKEVRDFYKRLLFFRGQIAGIGKMSYEPGASGPGYFSFFRRGREESVFLFLNVGKSARRISVPVREGEMVKDLFSCGNVFLQEENAATLQENSGIALWTAAK